LLKGTIELGKLLNIKVIQTLDEFRGLRDAWTTLLECAVQVSIFNTWEWQFYWWEYYGKDRPLRLVVAADSFGIVGILPLYIETRRIILPISVRLLRFVGTGGDTSPEYLGPIIRRDGAENIVEQLATFVFEELAGWDVLYLMDMREDCMFRRAVLSCRGARNLFDSNEDVSARTSFLSLPANVDDYFNSLNGHRRRILRQHRRRFESIPGARFFVWSDRATLHQAIERMIELHSLRWQNRSDRHAFQSGEYIGFHRDLMSACYDQDWLRLHCLAIDDRVIAMHYCYRFRGCISHFQSGFDPEFQKLGPGVCLMAYAIEQVIKEGNVEYDMLRGDYNYKTQWMKETRETFSFIAYKKNTAGLLIRLADTYGPQLKRIIKRIRAKEKQGPESS
jgi:CelD/BcsL family acetyltransferase involved in cellulose biosynthesis